MMMLQKTRNRNLRMILRQRPTMAKTLEGRNLLSLATRVQSLMQTLNLPRPYLLVQVFKKKSPRSKRENKRRRKQLRKKRKRKKLKKQRKLKSLSFLRKKDLQSKKLNGSGYVYVTA
jgi:hypothetical protein